jgi:hypothetical protein
LKGLEQGDLLPFYHYLNTPKVSRELMDLECLTYTRMNHPSGLDRARLAEWETRNLMMTAYIRRATALHGGKRVLVIVGGSHKPLFDRYLKQLVDVEVVQLRKRLKSPCWAFSTRTFPSGARMTRGLPLAKNYFSDSFLENWKPLRT